MGTGRRFCALGTKFTRKASLGYTAPSIGSPPTVAAVEPST